MPEQVGARHLPITASPIEQPFETRSFRFGNGGLDLRMAADLREPSTSFLRYTNVVHEGDGQLTGRPGQTLIASVGSAVHTIRRMNNPRTGTWTRIVGSGGSLYMGTSSVSVIDTGYSGDPLTVVPYRPPLSSDPWMFIADRSKCRKVRSDGLVLPIGLRKPATVISASADAVQSTPAVQWDSSDGTQASAWTATAGFDYSNPPLPTEVPTMNDGGSAWGGTVQFVTVPGDAVQVAAKGYYSFWSMPLTRNLSVVGSKTASDDDILHIRVKLSNPEFTSEVRLYFVISPIFSTGILPGTDSNATNADFYVKSWRTSDFSQFIMANQDQITAAETSRVHGIRDAALKAAATGDKRPTTELVRENTDLSRMFSVQASAGREQWLEYGNIGNPLRRGDFQRVGTTAGCDWSTITGIVIFVRSIDTLSNPFAVSFDDCYLYGGSGPDSSVAGDQAYDWRYTHYDARTGAESNPSPEMDASAKVDLARTSATLTPTGSGDSAVVQRFYRRGGSLTDDWYFLGANSGDGSSFTDDQTDDDIKAAGTLELDNDRFLTSIDTNGNALLEVEAPILFGPMQDLLFALGDTNRPGHVYYCKPGIPDSWPPDFLTEVCPPGEKLMNGGVLAGQAFCLSQERGYLLQPNLTGTTTEVAAIPTSCRKGLVGRWAMAIGKGYVWFVSEDGIYKTNGGTEEILSQPIQPLFEGKTVEGYAPIDLSAETDLRLEIHDYDLWFLYKDANGARQTLIYSILYDYWRHASFADSPRVVYADEGDTGNALLMGTAGSILQHSGTSDAGTPITVAVRTSNIDFGRPREDKLLGDCILDLDRAGVTVTVQTLLNHEAVANGAQTISDGTSRQRYIFNPFGTVPQRARTLGMDVAWATTAAPPTLYLGGIATIPEPDVTMTRVTQWDDIGSADEKYFTGCWLELDTGALAKTLIVEYDLGGIIATAATLTVTANGRHRFAFSWPVVKANMVRIRPNDDCAAIILYRVDWISQPEPPRIAYWDVNYENAWDVYLTGVDLDCNTFGATKTIEVFLESRSLGTFPITTAGRQVKHITIQPPVRGHLMRFAATDASPGLLYAHRWHFDEEPSEQTNWNQNYTVAGFMSDKWLKGVIFECDTFAQDKTVTVEVDGTVVETLTVNTDGRKVVECSFPQHLGRVFRIIPTDAFPSRLYQPPQLIFDLEPFALTRWETQEIDHGYALWEIPLYAFVTLKSTATVTLTLTTYNQEGVSTVKTYTIPSTGGAKVKRFVPFEATKGVLFKYLFTSTAPFWLYREESSVRVTFWGTGQTQEVKPFGNDDLDRTRSMVRADLAASMNGGGSL